jgi:hypothetical protein
MEEGAEKSVKCSITDNPMHSSLQSPSDEDQMHTLSPRSPDEKDEKPVEKLAKNTDAYFTSEQLWELFPFPASFGDASSDDVPLTLDPERLEFLAQYGPFHSMMGLSFFMNTLKQKMEWGEKEEKEEERNRTSESERPLCINDITN